MIIIIIVIFYTFNNGHNHFSVKACSLQFGIRTQLKHSLNTTSSAPWALGSPKVADPAPVWSAVVPGARKPRPLHPHGQNKPKTSSGRKSSARTTAGDEALGFERRTAERPLQRGRPHAWTPPLSFPPPLERSSALFAADHRKAPPTAVGQSG